MRKTALNMVYKLAKEDKRIFFVGSDLGVGTLQNFKNEMPERFFMEGVSEQNIISMSAGLALEGKIIYANTIATFITRRCFEQNVLDLGLHKANVRLIGNGGGLVYAPLGPTHEAIEDVAIMRAIPNMTIVAPSDAEEMKRLMEQTTDYKGPIYIRLAKGNDPIVSTDKIPFKIGKALSVVEGKDALVITTGITLKLALEAADILKKGSIHIGILHIPTIKPLDKRTIIKHAKKVSIIVTIEEHSIIGGLGSAVAETIAEENFQTPKLFKRIGIPDIFPEGYGSQAEQMDQYLINAKNLVLVIKNLLKK